ncbi:MAG: helix-turn-helix transcriptional regulator [Anaerolineales bacterium]
MPFIVLYNDEGKVIYQINKIDAQEFVKNISDSGELPGYSESTKPSEIKGSIFLTDHVLTQKPIAPQLSKRQFVVLQYLASSLTPQQIALKLGISKPTIHMHISMLKKKFNAESRDQLMAMAGFLEICDPFKHETLEEGKTNIVITE